ncbi:hypothetical protein BGZ63DRAFT_18955 [Mariannaea sp. PMI_226]|nr:hypothetical protein BGZ63DRAFT_18955 [Mariannaea sp. PMI_226]
MGWKEGSSFSGKEWMLYILHGISESTLHLALTSNGTGCVRGNQPEETGRREQSERRRCKERRTERERERERETSFIFFSTLGSLSYLATTTRGPLKAYSSFIHVFFFFLFCLAYFLTPLKRQPCVPFIPPMFFASFTDVLNFSRCFPLGAP